MARVLVVAAHPDDEVLGCGGTIAAHVAAGDEVHVALLADGLGSRGAASTDALDRHRAAARRANAALGVAAVSFGDFPDNAMDTVPALRIATAVEALIAGVDPSVVYTHHPEDLNIDHRLVSEAVAVACRPLPGSRLVDLLFFEVPSSTEWRLGEAGGSFRPTWFVDVDPHLETKLAALRHYDHEMRPWPHPRSYEAVVHLARWRGASVGLAAAEAFVLGRRVSRRGEAGA